MRDCIFCGIAAGEEPAHLLYEDDLTVAFLDINPVTRGHTLVIPRAHADDMWDVGEEDALAVMRTARVMGATLRRALEPAGCNLFQATRAVAGQTVFHLHLHVLPRYDATELGIQLGQRGAEAGELEEVAEAVRAVGADDG